MTDFFKQNWKTMLICFLAAIIVFLLYQNGKQRLKTAPLQQNNLKQADGKEVKTETVIESLPLEDVFSQYRSGQIDRETAIAKSGLPQTTFYRKLGKYDKSNVIQGDSTNA